MAHLVVALSGGVDSAVATARLVAAGHDVGAVHLVLQDAVDGRDAPAVQAARRVADALGIAFEVWDLRAEFEASVLADFAREYSAGRTPNPCLRCNRTIKFGALLDRALAAGFDGVATGHYARLVRHGPVIELHRAADRAKDQSYVLGVLSAHQLGRAWFPLGESTKAEVRAEAARLGLPVAHTGESMDLCFVPDGDTGAWLRTRLGERPGAIVDETGAVIGHHAGTYRFTIGQRKGLRLGSPAADGLPRYVVGVDATTGTVRVGPRNALRADTMSCGAPTWCGAPPAGSGGFRAGVQVRAHAPEVAGTVHADDARTDVELDAPIHGVAPGQTAVFYDGTRVVGSATILAASAV